MKLIRSALLGLLVISTAHGQSTTTVSDANPAEELAILFSDYDERWLELNPALATLRGDHRYNDRLGNPISPEHIARTELLVRESLESLAEFDPAILGHEDRVSYEVFRFERELELDGIEKGIAGNTALLPVDQLGSFPIYLAMFGSGTMVQPFRSVEDYENWIKRSGEFSAWVDQAIKNMQRGANRRIVLPQVVAERTIPVLAGHIVTNVERSVFYKPIAKMPDTISAHDANRLESLYRDHISTVLVPAYKKLHDFLVVEYLPRTRPTVGLGALPGGPAWYAYLVKQHTTSNHSPSEIHEIGRKRLIELAREMEEIKRQVGFEGTLAGFFVELRTNPMFYCDESEDLVAMYEGVRDRVGPHLPQLFNVMPKTDYLIREVESFRAPSAPAAQYIPGTPDGTRPGVFYVNTFKLDERPKFEVEAISLHEAAPGHHFQISISQEIEGMPAFRRFSMGPTSNAYVEGWGLYAESLGEELGMYKDPYQRMGLLAADALRCGRLVVDTGLHAFGWTREKAIEEMKKATPLSEQDITAEIERYIAWPGQALGYKIGQLKIRELRTRSEQALGDEFDVRGFHDVVLKLGAVPLVVLEREVDQWLQSRTFSEP